MSFKNACRSTITLSLSAVFVFSQIPTNAFAKAVYQQPLSAEDVGIPTDLFPVDTKKESSARGAQLSANLSEADAKKAGAPAAPKAAEKAAAPVISVPQVPASNAPKKMKTMEVAAVPEEYACPLFDNRPNAELLSAIDSLTKQVNSNPGCKDDAAASAVNNNTDTLKSSVTALKQMTQISDPTQVNVADIETSVTAAIQATQNLGNILGNDSFLNSKCGRETMSTGNALLSLNNILNGLGPYALMAVSLNAALAPALPFVIGGIAVTSGISVATKMYKENTLDMSKPEFRKALLQNTCQYIKVAKKVRFMELAQSGQINKITEELQNNIQSYQARFSQPSRELYSLLKLKESSDKMLEGILEQIRGDRLALTEVDAQIAENNDDLMVCTFARELAASAQKDNAFPTSAIVNLENAVKSVVNAPAIQAKTMRAMHTSSITRILAITKKTQSEDSVLKTCAQMGRSWIAGIRQTINTTAAIISKEQKSVDVELSQNSEFRQWKAKYNQVKIEQITVDRVEKALEALAQDNSIIDRSELSQRMAVLKSGLFGSSGFKVAMLSGAPPVLAWLEYTKKMFDQEAAKFIAGFKKLKEGDLSFSSSGKNPQLDLVGIRLVAPTVQVERIEAEVRRNIQNAENLVNINLKNLPLGSRQNEVACQQLEASWLSWSASLDHLGATQLFCNMIDNALDIGVDKGIIKFCRGQVDLNGRVNSTSAINEAKKILVDKGYQKAAILISAKLKELKCPMPTVSVMNK